MSWFWLNMPLAAVFFGAWVGIPLWLVFKRPDERPAPPAAPSAREIRQAAAAEPVADPIPQRSEHLAGVLSAHAHAVTPAGSASRGHPPTATSILPGDQRAAHRRKARQKRIAPRG